MELSGSLRHSRVGGGTCLSLGPSLEIRGPQVTLLLVPPPRVGEGAESVLAEGRWAGSGSFVPHPHAVSGF